MNKIAKRLVDKLVNGNIVDLEDRDFYQYAIEGLLLYFVNYVTIFCLAGISGRLIECFVFLICFFLLRTYCGGIHMKTWYSCYIASCAIIQFILLISHMIQIGWTVLLIGLFICEMCIWKLAPCVHPNHPMEEQEIKRCQQKAKINSCIATCVIIFLKFFEKDIYVMLCFSAECLTSGLLTLGYKKYSLKNNFVYKKEGRL